jgi:hypothetical protein
VCFRKRLILEWEEQVKMIHSHKCRSNVLTVSIEEKMWREGKHTSATVLGYWRYWFSEIYIGELPTSTLVFRLLP